MKISSSDYQKILKQVQLSITQAQHKIIRSKIEMSWKIGQIIDLSLDKKDEKTYGKNLIEKLEKDVGINEKTLYKMRSFFQTYPKLPKDDSRLNWSHYRILSGIKEDDERKALEDLTRENSWGSDALQEEVTKRKTNEKTPSIKSRIQPTRGKVFNYKIIEIIGSDKKFIDCGFGIFREVAETLPRDATMVLVQKKDKKYSLKKSATPTKQVYTYKAFLKRIIDGDTLRVNLDLGFGIWHEEIIRLAKINASESKTDEGKKATTELKKILESAPFFILKSIKTDIFNRYVADIFLPEKDETDLQKIVDKGVYLNQLLLDRGVAELF